MQIEVRFQTQLFFFSSVESSLYKGTAVLVRAVRKILSSKEAATMRRQKCVLEISDKGIKMIDKSVDPCENFYAYSCGKYITEEPIPMFQVKGSLWFCTC